MKCYAIVNNYIVVIMDKQEFFEMSNLRMSQITGKGRQRFSEYNAGKPIGEKALFEYSEKFGVSPGTLLDWIIEWRDYDVFDPDATYARAYRETESDDFFVGDDKRLGRFEGDPVMRKEIFLGLSVEEMREMLQISNHRLNSFIKGTRMDEKTIRMLAHIFRLTPGSFLDWFTEWKRVVSEDVAGVRG